MSYTVLARKWRPKLFAELVGQSHVMQALSNALDQQRLHHAYLFTGTRGVGKTTIARIFAKALNCEHGVSSQPCGVCHTCRSIDEGRFIDLIEVDAASRTKVDDTREILDNVQFAPTQGRYKVYLIDEVHMLSKSSFNALLKTLEEPPEHVKFLLATTDPHKLPITVLSRCLQFNLMRLTQPQIQGHLAYILEQEKVPFDDGALALIAKSADGSARDSLSLLDQAIAYGAGEVLFDPVQTMLGLVDQQFGIAILQALATDSGEALKEIIQKLAVMGVDYQALLSQLIEGFHALSYQQVFAQQEQHTLLPAELLTELAEMFSAERVQMLYQIGLLAKQDMQLAPDVRIAFEMTLMRMLAFQPAVSAAERHTPPAEKPSVRGSAVAEVAQSQPYSGAGNAINKATDNASGNIDNGMSPSDAIASLASARSLVGKKNAEISQPTSAVSTAVPQQNESKTQQYRVEEPASDKTAPSPFSDQEAKQDSMAASGGDAGEARFIEERPTVRSNSQEPAFAESAPAMESDHLTQIKEKLKQSLGRANLTLAEPKLAESKLAKSSSMHSKPSELSGGQGEQPRSMQRTITPPSVMETKEAERPIVEPSSEAFYTEDGFANQSNRLQKATPPFDSPKASLHDARQEQDQFQPSSHPVSYDEYGIHGQPDWNAEPSLEPIHQSVQMGQGVEFEATSAVDSLNLPSDGILNDDGTPKDRVGQSAEPVNSVETTDLKNDRVAAPPFESSGDRMQDWQSIISMIQINGMAAEFARNCVLVAFSEDHLAISLDPQQQYAKPDIALDQIQQAVQQTFGEHVALKLVQADAHFTPNMKAKAELQNKVQQAHQSIEKDVIVHQFQSVLGMEIVPGTVKSIN